MGQSVEPDMISSSTFTWTDVPSKLHLQRVNNTYHLILISTYVMHAIPWPGFGPHCYCLVSAQKIMGSFHLAPVREGQGFDASDARAVQVANLTDRLIFTNLS